MKTTKPIATISYNSEEFLRDTLERLTKNHIISFGCYIVHQPEEDEKKAHAHCYIIPSKMTQTDELKDVFRELDPQNISKPLGVMPFVSSKFDDWYLYAIHDKGYLASKFERRKYEYSRSQMWSTDDDFLNELVRSISMVRVNSFTKMKELQEAGWTWQQYLLSGAVPIQQVRAFSDAWQQIAEILHNPAQTQRNGRENHENAPSGVVVDPLTGEVIEMP